MQKFITRGLIFLSGLGLAISLALLQKNSSSNSYPIAKSGSAYISAPEAVPLKTTAEAKKEEPRVEVARPADSEETDSQLSRISSKLERTESGTLSGSSEAQDAALNLSAKSPAERSTLLRQALHEGTFASLQLLDSRVLSKLPSYLDRELPEAKHEALAEMLRRFRDIDWSNWKLSAFAVNGGPTAARRYVDVINIVNIEVGSYLETSAELLHSLYLNTQKGNVFAEDRALKALLNAPNSSSSDTNSGKVITLDSQILLDPVFRENLESLREQFIVSYVDGHSEDPRKNLNLLLSIEPKLLAKSSITALTRLFRRFALEASPRFREEIFADLHNSETLSSFLAVDATLRRSVAELYLIGVLDALEDGDNRRATYFLQESNALYPGLKGQEMLAQRLQLEPTTAASKKPTLQNVDNASHEEKEKIAPKGSKSLFPETASNTSDTKIRSTIEQGISYLFIVLLAVVFGGGVFFFVLYQRSLRSLDITPLSAVKEGSRKTQPITSPSSVDFEDSFESRETKNYQTNRNPRFEEEQEFETPDFEADNRYRQNS